MEEKIPKKKLSGGIVAAIIIVVLLVVAAAGYCGLCKWVQDNGRLLPGAMATDTTGVMTLDLDVGKLPRDEALAQLTAYMDSQLEQRSLTLKYDGKTAVLSGALLDFDPVAAIDYAVSVKEAQPFLRLGVLWLGLAKEPVDLALSASSLTPEGELEVQQLIEQLTRELYIAPVDYSFEVSEADSTLTLTFGTEGRKIVSEGLLGSIQAALVSGQSELDIPTESIPSAELTGHILSEEVYTAPQVSQKLEDGTLTPTKFGYGVDPDEAQALMDACVNGETTCTIPLLSYKPDISGAEDYLFEDLLATVTSSMDGVENRSFNVRRAAESCNEYVLLPGEVFSYIGAIGSPSVENGYMTSTGYQGGQTVEMAGGGVCQVSSSIYYCAVYSNLEIVHRANHAFTVGYVPNGLDATMYYPSLDFKFRNNTDYPIKIVTSTTPGAWGKLTVSFYGYKADDSYVKTEINTLSTTPWNTVYKPDETIPVGTTKVDVTPYTGYTVEVYRLVYNGDGTLRSRTYENFSKYSKRDKVILFNPADAASLGLYPDGTPIPVEEPPAATDPVTGG